MQLVMLDGHHKTEAAARSGQPLQVLVLHREDHHAADAFDEVLAELASRHSNSASLVGERCLPPDPVRADAEPQKGGMRFG